MAVVFLFVGMAYMDIIVVMFAELFSFNAEPHAFRNAMFLSKHIFMLRGLCRLRLSVFSAEAARKQRALKGLLLTYEKALATQANMSLCRLNQEKAMLSSQHEPLQAKIVFQANMSLCRLNQQKAIVFQASMSLGRLNQQNAIAIQPNMSLGRLTQQVAVHELIGAT